MASIVESFVLAKSYTKSMNLGSSQQESLFLFCSLGKLSIIIKQLSNPITTTEHYTRYELRTGISTHEQNRGLKFGNKATPKPNPN